MPSILESLTQRAKDQQKLLKQERERKKNTPDQNLAQEVPDFVESYDFWCELCQEDFTSSAFKAISIFQGTPIVVVRGTHDYCETESIRYATHRDQDPYYDKSEKIRLQRGQYANDFLQAHEYGFQSMWNKRPYGNFEQRLKEREEQALRQDWDLGLKGKSMATREQLTRIRRR